MKAAKTWCLATLVVVAGISSASCGKDDFTRGGGGNGSVTTTSSNLGKACVNDSQCADTTAPGLTCLTGKETVLDGAAPPKGLCTTTCTTDDECTPFGAGAICYPFSADAQTGYCIEGCTFGDPDVGAPAKCHDRVDFACNPALVADTSAACTSSDECDSGELCLGGTCNIVFPACLPACRGDLDCESGLYCDQSFLHGTCTPNKPTGKALGEPCTPVADNEPAEPDECLGFCQGDDATGKTGHCANTCSIGAQCGWNPTSKQYDGACFFAPSLLGDSAGVGDYGFCTQTCDCNSECNVDPDAVCQLLPG